MGIGTNPSSAHEDNLLSWKDIPAGMKEDSPNRIDPNGVPMLYTFSTYKVKTLPFPTTLARPTVGWFPATTWW